MTRAHGAVDRLYRALMGINRSRSRIDPWLEVLGGGSVAAALGFAGWRAAMGAGTLGNFTGFVTALLLAAQPLRALGSLNAALQEGLAGLARVFSVIDEPPGIVETRASAKLPAGHGRLAFEDVFFTYPDGRPGLRGLAFVAEPGLTVALVGPSGAGKSTALALILPLHRCDGRRDPHRRRRRALGNAGEPARRHRPASARSLLLFDDTVAANIRMGRPLAPPTPR